MKKRIKEDAPTKIIKKNITWIKSNYQLNEDFTMNKMKIPTEGDEKKMNTIDMKN